MAGLGFVYLFRNPNRFVEVWATHILASVSCSVWTKITQPLKFLLIPQKKHPQLCQNKLSKEYVYLLRWFQWKNCNGLGILVHFTRFSWKPCILYSKMVKKENQLRLNVWNKSCSICSKFFYCEIRKIEEINQRVFFSLSINQAKIKVFEPFLPYFGDFTIIKKCNSNLEHM